MNPKRTRNPMRMNDPHLSNSNCNSNSNRGPAPLDYGVVDKA